MLSLYGLPKEYVEATYWACDYLNIDNIHIVFDFCKIDDNYHGEVVDYSLKEKSYYLDISDCLSEEKTLIAIFHELVHIQQILEKRLNFEDGPTIWLGEEYIYDMPQIYDLLPWEIEAYKKEKILLVEWYKNCIPSSEYKLSYKGKL